MLDVVEGELELAERVRARGVGVLLEDTTRWVDMKDGIDLERACLAINGMTRVPVVLVEVDAVLDGTADCDRRPRIGPRICAFEFASKAIGAVSSPYTNAFRDAVSENGVLVTSSFSPIRAPAS